MSTTTNLKLFKHDNPTTNTNQFDIEKSLNENWDKLDANAGEISSKIQTLENTTNAKDTSQDEEIQALKAENTLLKSQIPSATVVGETIHLEDSSNMQCQISPLGASKQETREGYNLLNLSSFSNQAINGLTITKNNDDSINVKGTPTAQTDIYLYGSYEGTEKLSGLSSGETFRIKGTKNSNIQLHTNLGYSADGNDFNKTVPEASGLTYIFYRFLSGVQFNITLYPMVYKGTEEKPYEQYGASPSIEYEAPIESVGDNIQLFNIEDITENLSINSANGNITSSISNTSGYIEVLPNTEYTLNYDTDNNFRYICFYDKNKNAIDTENDKGLYNKAVTFKTTNETYFLRFGYYKYANNVKLEKGTKATPYSPYGQGSVEIKNTNKNIFDLKTYFENCGVSRGTKTLLENGIKIDFEADADCYLGAAVDKGVSLPISHIKALTKVKPNTVYTITINATPKCYISFLNKEFIAVHPYHFFEKKYEKVTYTFNTGNDTEYIYIRLGIQSVNYTTFTFEGIQIEEGNTATDYVEHQSQTKALYTQQPFRAIGDVKDRFVKVDGVDYEKHPIARYIFNGSENFVKSGSGYWYYVSLPTASIKNDNGSLSNYFVNGNWVTESKENQICISNGVQGLIGISTKSFASIEELKTFLTEKYTNGTPVYVDYVLATPTLIECTPEQVEVLESFNTYKNVTNISSDSIGELEVTYSKDIETLLNNISQAVLGGN